MKLGKQKQNQFGHRINDIWNQCIKEVNINLHKQCQIEIRYKLWDKMEEDMSFADAIDENWKY